MAKENKVRVKVIKEFADKQDGYKTKKVGKYLTLSKDRASYLIQKGNVELEKESNKQTDTTDTE